MKSFSETLPPPSRGRVKAGAFAPATSSRSMCLPFVVFERSCRTCHLRRRGATGSTDMCREAAPSYSFGLSGTHTHAASDEGRDPAHDRWRARARPSRPRCRCGPCDAAHGASLRRFGRLALGRIAPCEPQFASLALHAATVLGLCGLLCASRRLSVLGLWWRLSSGPIELDLATPWLKAAIEENFGGNHSVDRRRYSARAR